MLHIGRMTPPSRFWEFLAEAEEQVENIVEEISRQEVVRVVKTDEQGRFSLHERLAGVLD